METALGIMQRSAPDVLVRSLSERGGVGRRRWQWSGNSGTLVVTAAVTGSAAGIRDSSQGWRTYYNALGQQLTKKNGCPNDAPTEQH